DFHVTGVQACALPIFARAVNLMMIDLEESKEQLAMAERVAAWKEIAQRLAHEIKNPLTPIQMSVETLRKTWAKQHPSFDEIFERSEERRVGKGWGARR